MPKIAIRTHSGHPLFVRRARMHVPGEATEVELTDGQVAALHADCRVLVGAEIEAMVSQLSAPRGKPRGNTPAPRVHRDPTPEEAQAPDFLVKESDKPKRRRRSKAD